MSIRDRLNELRQIAVAMDRGGRSWEWRALGESGYPQRIERQGDVVLIADTFDSPDRPSTSAEFIAAFDPPTVLALLDEIDRLPIGEPVENDDALVAQIAANPANAAAAFRDVWRWWQKAEAERIEALAIARAINGATS